MSIKHVFKITAKFKMYEITVWFIKVYFFIVLGVTNFQSYITKDIFFFNITMKYCTEYHSFMIHKTNLVKQNIYFTIK